MTKTLKKNTAKTTAKQIIQDKHKVSTTIQKILKSHTAQDKKLILNILKKGKIDKTLKKKKKKKTKKKTKDVNVSAVKINIELTKHLLRINNLTKNFNGSQSALMKELKKDKHKYQHIKYLTAMLKPKSNKKLKSGFGHFDHDYDDHDHDDHDHDYDDHDHDHDDHDHDDHDHDYDDHDHDDHDHDYDDHHSDHDSNLPDCGSYVFNPETGLGNANCIPKDDAPQNGHFEDCCEVGSHVIGNAEASDETGETEGQNDDSDHDSKLCEQTAAGMTGSGDIFCKQRYYQLNHGGQAGVLGDLENLHTDGGNNIYFNPAQPISDGEGDDSHYDDLDNDSLVYERCCFEDDAEGGNFFTDDEFQSTDENLRWTDSDGEVDPNLYLNKLDSDSQETTEETLLDNVDQYNQAVDDPNKDIPEEVYDARIDRDYLHAAGWSGSGNDGVWGDWTQHGLVMGSADNTDELKGAMGEGARWFSDEHENSWTGVDRGDLVQGAGSTGSNFIGYGNNFNSSQDGSYSVINTNP